MGFFQRYRYTKKLIFCPICGSKVDKIKDFYIHPENSCEYSNDGIIIESSDDQIIITIIDKYLQEMLKKRLKEA